MCIRDSGWVDAWMLLRDRRGPLGALVLLVAYALLLVEAALMLARWHYGKAMPVLVEQDSRALRIAIALCAAGAVWRLILRFTFTAREAGGAEGPRAVARQPLANIIHFMAGRRALFAYMRSLAGQRLVWEKTEHRLHPAHAMRALALRKARR